MQKWAKIILTPLSLPQWQRIWDSISKASRCVEQRETPFKILMFWYRTLEVLHKFDPSIPQTFWRCLKDIGTHYHIFWDCPMIRPFWNLGQSLLQDLFEMDLPLDPVHYLLGLPIPGVPKHTKKCIYLILLATKKVISTCWLSSNPPTQSQLVQTVTHVCRMEHRTAVNHDSLSHIPKLWDM